MINRFIITILAFYTVQGYAAVDELTQEQLEGVPLFMRGPLQEFHIEEQKRTSSGASGSLNQRNSYESLVYGLFYQDVTIPGSNYQLEMEQAINDLFSIDEIDVNAPHEYINKLTNFKNISNSVINGPERKENRENSRAKLRQKLLSINKNKKDKNICYVFINTFLDLSKEIDEGNMPNASIIDEMEKLAHHSCLPAIKLCEWYHQNHPTKSEIFQELLRLHTSPTANGRIKYFNQLDCIKESILQFKRTDTNGRIHQASTVFEDIDYIEFAIVKALPLKLQEKYNDAFKELSNAT